MNLKKFQALDIGTVLMYGFGSYTYIEIKVSKNCTLILNRNMEGGITNYYKDYWLLSFLRLAPKWIAKRFEVKQ